ncbi:MAG: histidine phosphatase family protein [Candidatus Paceibacterota bacterium]|jgi:broad specificity phosphatase PhoE
MNPNKNSVLKRVYFVRHGETAGNAAGRSQTSDIPLSERGKKQAQFVAERFTRIGIDKIFASPYTRAKETAETIGNKIGKKIVFDELLREIKRPSEIIGKSHYEEEYHRIIGEVEKRELSPGDRYQDEETLFEMEIRARAVLDMLLRDNKKDILVVSHDVFLKMVLAAMMISDARLCVEVFREMRYFMTLNNTSITMAAYCEEPRGGLRWRLRTWNDQAHLG